MLDEFWRRGDKVVCDWQRLETIGKRMFGRNVRQKELISYETAKRLAMAMLMDFGYREWRSEEMRKKREDNHA